MFKKIASFAERLGIVKRIRRLSLMLLPSAQYVDILFDLIGLGILCTDHRLIMFNGAGFVSRHIDYSRYKPLYERLFSLNRREAGAVVPAELLTLGRGNVIVHDEIALPNYQNGFLYNEINKTLGYYYIIMAKLFDSKNLMGFFTIFRSKDMPVFTNEDVLFLEMVAPFISYGLFKSKVLEETFTEPVNLEAGIFKLRENEPGYILVAKNGEIVYINDAIKNMFLETNMLEHARLPLFEASCGDKIVDCMGYINAVVRNYFDVAGAAGSTGGTPMPQRIYTSKTGRSFLLKGYYLESIKSSEKNLVAITVEEVCKEPFLSLKKRIIYNFTDKEAAVLLLLKENLSPAEITDRLNITRSTFKTHMSNVMNKIEITSTRELKRFAATSF
jgi:DNA-binding CsgD family transcriptional regulator